MHGTLMAQLDKKKALIVNNKLNYEIKRKRFENILFECIFHIKCATSVPRRGSAQSYSS